MAIISKLRENMQQNVTGAYLIIMLVYRRLLTTRLHAWQSSCVISNNAQKNNYFVHGYNLEVLDVIKYENIVPLMLRASQVLCDV